ncbi:MAG: hypothetical protein ACLQVN_07110 [Bryobacteraceae bacterium]
MKAIAWVLSLCWVAAAQSNQPSIQTSGQCSPVTPGSGNTLSITCSGLTAQQARLLANIPALINRLLAVQADNTAEILAKLNTCVAQSAPRVVSGEQKRGMIEALKGPPGQPEVRIRATNSTAESSRYANQLQDAFASIPGWKAPPVFENMVAGMALPIGLTAYVQNERSPYGIAIQRLFKELAIDITFGLDASLPPDVVIIVVGQKPVE